MTREEQIDWLCRLRAYLNNGVISTPWNKEFTEILNEILDQEPCGDCIRREDALMALTGEWTELTDEIIHRFIKRIKNLPPVTPQPKTGQWKRVSIDKYVQHAMAFYRCSECGNDIIGEHNYCPNCGAKME